MSAFSNIWESIISIFFITSSDSEESKAKKIMWYAFFGSFFMIAAISWIIFIVLTFSTNTVKVPNIEGDTIYNALKKLGDKELVVNPRVEYSEDFQEGIVYEQTPSPGTLVKRGRTIKFHLSLGNPQMSLPDFIGLSLFDISTYLDRQYPNMKIPYKITIESYEFSDSKEYNRIITQEPDEGTPINTIEEVKLIVSKGVKDPNQISCGDYLGKKLDTVLDEMAKLEVYYNLIFKITQDKNKNNEVFEQSISPGFPVKEMIFQERVLELSTYKYMKSRNNEDLCEIRYDIPKKPVPYQLEIIIEDSDTNRDSILKMSTKGGVFLNLPYFADQYSKVIIKHDDLKVYEAPVEKKEAELTVN